MKNDKFLNYWSWLIFSNTVAYETKYIQLHYFFKREVWKRDQGLDSNILDANINVIKTEYQKMMAEFKKMILKYTFRWRVIRSLQSSWLRMLRKSWDVVSMNFWLTCCYTFDIFSVIHAKIINKTFESW